MIEVTDLVKNYGPVAAVRGVSLDVARGEVVVLIGPSLPAPNGGRLF